MSRLADLMRRFGWNRSKHDARLTGRLYHLSTHRYRWYDWGHRVMAILGRANGGSYDNPSPPTWWYVEIAPKIMWRTRYPRRRYEVVKSYDEMRRRTSGLNEDEMYRWRAVGADQDGDVVLGRRWWGDPFYGLDYAEVRIVHRWMRRWRWKNWFGLRSWLYTQALHAAVNQRKPFSCGVNPPAGSGGYSHWRCQLKKRHDGLHRFNAYVWGDVGGIEMPLVAHEPEVKQ